MLDAQREGEGVSELLSLNVVVGETDVERDAELHALAERDGLSVVESEPQAVLEPHALAEEDAQREGEGVSELLGNVEGERDKLPVEQGEGERLCDSDDEELVLGVSVPLKDAEPQELATGEGLPLIVKLTQALVERLGSAEGDGDADPDGV